MVLVLTPSTSFVAASLCVRYTGLFSQPLTSELGVQPLLSWSTLVGVGKAGPSHCLVSISIAYPERKPRSQDGLRTAYGHLELDSRLFFSPCFQGSLLIRALALGVHCPFGRVCSEHPLDHSPTDPSFAVSGMSSLRSWDSWCNPSRYMCYVLQRSLQLLRPSAFYSVKWAHSVFLM